MLYLEKRLLWQIIGRFPTAIAVFIFYAFLDMINKIK